ncbi:MAG: TIGR02281 family clan AA aspartic protease [Sphingomonadaceae bacterium]|nr:TIGR02281 family clan AA aspartic protease [Sphingomonadaceae bacterium]
MNGGNQALDFIYLLLVLILVGSGLMVRRLPLGRTVKMATAWLLIFGAFFLAFTLRDDFAALGRRAYAEIRGDNVVASSAGEIRIRASEDGHFYANGEVNGHSVRFLIDSGATVTTLSREAAREANVQPDGGFGVIVDTANGSALFDRATADRLEIGPIARSALAVQISRSDGGINVIGMNFLSTLSRWGVEGQVLVLKS